jgi:hypothetical protein
MAVSMNFFLRSSSENCSDRILPGTEISFEKAFAKQLANIMGRVVFIQKSILPMVQYQLKQLPEK